MCYTVIPTPKFLQDIEYYEKKKKFRNITDYVDSVVKDLEIGNLVGDDIPDIDIPTDNHTYKVRVANSNTKVGKSNGYRIIYYVVKDDKEIYLITIYYKKEDKNIPTKKLQISLKNIVFKRHCIEIYSAFLMENKYKDF